MKNKKAFWLAAPFAIVLGAFILWWGVRGQALLADLKQTIAAEMSRATGARVLVEAADITDWNVITLSHTVVYDKQNREVVKSAAAAVEVNPFRLLWSGPILESVTHVTLFRPEVRMYRDTSGQWNIDEMLKDEIPAGRDFKGKVTLAAGQVFLHSGTDQWDVAGVSGWVDFSQNPCMRFKLAAGPPDARISADGSLTTQAMGSLNLRVENFELAGWKGILPSDIGIEKLAGKLSFLEVSLRRDENRVRFRGDTRIAKVNGRLSGVDWTDATAYVTFNEQEIKFYDASAKIDGQMLTGHGSFRFPGSRWDEFQAEGQVFLAQTNIGAFVFQNSEVKGKVNHKPEQTDIQITEGKGTVAGEAFSGVKSHLIRKRIATSPKASMDEWQVLEFAANIGGGTLTASGVTRFDTATGIALQGRGIPLEILARTFPGLLVSGRADGEGMVSGPLEELRLDADVRASTGQVFHQPFERAEGRIALHHNVLSVFGGEIRQDKTTHDFSGKIGLTGYRAIDLAVKTKAARAENLARWLLPEEKVTGNIDAEMKITGSWNDPDAIGTLTLYEGSFRGYLLNKASGNFVRRNSIIHIDDFAVDAFNAKLKLSGTLDGKDNASFRVTARDVDLAALQIRFPYPVQGKVDITGTLTGSRIKPIFEGDVTARNVRVNGQDLFEVAGSLKLMPDRAEIASATFLQGTGRYRFNGGHHFETGELFGGLSVENAEVLNLLALLNTPIKGVTGRLNGQVAITGTVDRPALQIFGTLNAGRIRGYALDSIDLDVSVRNNVVSVNNFLARQGTGRVIVKGTADLAGPLALEVGGKDIDAGLLTAWFDTTVEAQGKMDFLAQLNGTAAKPKGAMSLEIRNGGVANATFDALYGMLLLSDDVIAVEQLFINKGDHRASLYGTVPLKALNKAWRSQASTADSMNLRFRLDQADLSILPLLSNEVEWATGPTKGEVWVTGTLAKPIFNGNITVDRGAMKFRSVADPLEQIGIDIRFQDDTINIVKAIGFMGGGSANLEGTLTINGEQGLAAYGGRLKLDNLQVRQKYFKGPLNGELLIVNKNGKPTLAGQIRQENTVVHIPTIPEIPKFSSDIGLDIEFAVAKGVRAQVPALFDLWLEGQYHFSGTAREPVVSGRMKIYRGTIDYLNTRFRIVEGNVTFPATGLLEPQVHLEAQANLSRTQVILKADGPATEMNLRLSSIPALSSQEIRTVLALRGRSDQMRMGGIDQDVVARQEMVALLQSGLRIGVVGEIESSIQEALGLDDFRVVSTTRVGRDPNFPVSSVAGNSGSIQEIYTLEVGKYILDKVQVTHSQGLNQSESTTSIRYDISHQVSISGMFGDKSKARVGAEIRFSF